MNAFVDILIEMHEEGIDLMPSPPYTPPYTLRAWADGPSGHQERLFSTSFRYVTPEQRSAAIIWLDARRRETPTGDPFDAGVDIFADGQWIPFTDLNGRDMWSGKIRTGDARNGR